MANISFKMQAACSIFSEAFCGAKSGIKKIDMPMRKGKKDRGRYDTLKKISIIYE